LLKGAKSRPTIVLEGCTKKFTASQLTRFVAEQSLLTKCDGCWLYCDTGFCFWLSM